jgi:hypothetical protein
MEKAIQALSEAIVEKIINENCDAGKAVKIYVGALIDSVFLQLPRSKRLQLVKMAKEESN